MCHPHNEQFYINLRVLDAPAIADNVYVCDKYTIHVCQQSTANAQVEVIHIPRPYEITFRLVRGCYGIHSHDHASIICAISRRHISTNVDSISFDVSFSLSEKTASSSLRSRMLRSEDVADYANTGLPRTPADDSVGLIQTTADNAREIIHLLFQDPETRLRYKRLRDADIEDAERAIIQSEKSCLNSHYYPNLFLILAAIPQQYKNITLEYAFPNPLESTINYILDIVMHCVRLAIRYRDVLHSPGTTTNGTTYSPNYNKLIRDISSKRHTLALIYCMRSGITFGNRQIVPRVEYINRYAPRITVLTSVIQEKSLDHPNIIRKEQSFSNMCRQILAAGVSPAELCYTGRNLS